MVTKAEAITQEFIHGKLDASAAAVESALLAILERQTAEERAGKYSVITNGVGCSKYDAEICTSFCERSANPLSAWVAFAPTFVI